MTKNKLLLKVKAYPEDPADKMLNSLESGGSVETPSHRDEL